MKLVGLRFLLVDRMFFMAVLSEQKAKEILKKWLSRQYQIEGVQCIGDIDSSTGDSWGVRIDDIRAIHTVDLESLQQQPQQQIQPSYQYPGTYQQTRYTSGY